ncbi:MAG: hypothetical protein VXW22_10885, partial [Pseudomonadota bacterium]|nr:hypothetical protein [Pseudomonadota bacterium]
MNLQTKRRLVQTTILAGLAGFSFGAVALAQDADTDDEARQETVTVTGSRIMNSNLSSSSPIANVSSDDLTLSNTVN